MVEAEEKVKVFLEDRQVCDWRTEQPAEKKKGRTILLRDQGKCVLPGAEGQGSVSLRFKRDSLKMEVWKVQSGKGNKSVRNWGRSQRNGLKKKTKQNAKKISEMIA